MGKIFKRTLATIMVVLMVITSAPLSGFVGVDWNFDWLNLSARAEDEESEKPDNWVDYSDLTPNQYMAKVLLRHNYIGYYCVDEDAQSFKNEQYENSFNTRLYSAARGLHYPLSIDTDFITGIALWEFLNFDPSEAYEKVLYKKDYYFAIIMSILDAQIKSSEFSENINNSYSKMLLDLESITTKIGKTNSDINLSNLNTKLSESSKSEYINSLIELSSTETGNEFWNYYGKGVSYFKDALGVCNNVEEIVKTLGSYIILAQLGEDVKSVLYGLYTNCDPSNNSLRVALYEAYQSCNNEFNTSIISIIETGNSILNYSFKAVVDQVWSACVSSIAGGFGGGLLLGQVIGKSISNFAFSTDATKEQFYALGCLVEFEELMVDTVRYFENLYKGNETSDNANAFIKSLEMLYATYDLGDEYAIDFLEIAYEKGFYRKVTSWIFGSNQDIETYKNNIRCIQKDTRKVCENLVNIECFRDGYMEDAPSGYEDYFIDKSVVLNKSSYSNDEEIENIEFDYNVEKSHYFLYSYVINDDRTATITSCHPASRGDIVIPKDIHGFAIRKIKSSAFKDCIGITSIIFNSTLREIGYNAFYGCESLSEIALNDGLKTIGYGAFNGTSLTSVTIPKTVESMGYNSSYSPGKSVFSDIDTLKTVVFEYGMLEVPKYALRNCTSVTSISIPGSVTEIGSEAFYGCTGLTTVTLPNSLTEIGYNAFYGCESLSEIALNDGLKTIGYGAFNGTSLTSVTIPKTVESMGYNSSYSPGKSVFSDIDTLKTVVFEYGMLEVPKYALRNCTSVTSISIPGSVTEIGSEAFYGCTGLTTVTLPNSLNLIGYEAFRNCTALSSINYPNSLTEIRYNAFYGCESLSEIALNDGLKTIGYGAFNGTSLTSVTIPKTVESMGYNSSYSPGKSVFSDIDTLKTVVFEYGMLEVPKYALRNCTSVTSISIPGSVTEIGSEAFYGCTGLTTVTLPNSLNLIGYEAFRNCTALSSINYPNSLTEIRYNAFYGCENLSKIALNDGLKTIGYGAFNGTSLTSVTIPKTVESMGYNSSYSPGKSVFSDIDTLKTVVFEYGMLEVLKNALRNCSSVISISLPSSITTIDTYAFSECTEITEVYIPISVIKINNYAFNGCTGITDVYYVGSEEMWKQINIGTDNEPLTGATIHYNYKHSDHTYIPGVTKEALCLETGIMTYSCFCGDSYTEIIPAKGHQMGEYVIVKPATCKEKGEEKSFCDLCGTYVSSDIDYADHIDNNKDKICDICEDVSAKIIDTDIFGEEDNLIWTLYEDGQLVISGNGGMKDASGSLSRYSPWDSYCEQITSLVICEGVTNIGEAVFAACIHMKEVLLPSTLMEIGTNAFENTAIARDINNYVDNTLYIGDYLICVLNDAEFVDFRIKPGTKVVADSAFMNAWCFDGSFTIPASLIYLGENDFGDVSKFVVDTNNEYYSNDSDGVLYNKTKTALIRCPEDAFSKYESFTIPNTVVEIMNFACRDCKFGEVIMPEFIEKIGKFAFESCDNLTEVNLPDSLKHIGGSAFNGSEIESFTIGNCIESMGSNVFDNTPWFDAQPNGEIYAGNVFCDYKGDVNSVTELNIKPGTTVIAEYVMGYYIASDKIYNNYYPKVENLVLPEGIRTIGINAFLGLFDLKTVSMPSTIQKIYGFNFEYCYNLVVQFNGSEDLWKEVNIDWSNQNLINGTIYFNGQDVEHTPKTVIVPATCTTDGVKYTICEVCGEKLGASEIIAKLGHSYSSSYTTDKKATCTSEGSKSKHCTRSGCTAKTSVTKIAKLGHKYDNACDTSCNTCKAIRKITHSYKNVTTKATLTKNGKIENKCSVCGKVSKTTTIYYPKTIKLSKTSYTYNGKTQTPSVTVKDSKGNALKKDTDYTVKYASGRKSTGKYSVTITFKGKYSGTKTLYFNILPSKTSKITPTCSTTEIKASWKSVTGASGYKVELLNSKGKVVKSVTTTKTSYTFKKLSKVTTYKIRVTAYKTIDKKAAYSTVSTTITTSTAPAKVTLSKVTAGSKQATVAWKTTSGASGYELQYSTSSKFKSAKTSMVSKGSSKKTTIKKLTKGKKYYFKVRAYKTVDGKKVYGAWSTVKSVKVK